MLIMKMDSSKKIFILFLLGTLPFISSTAYFLYTTSAIRKNEVISNLRNFTVEIVNDCVMEPKKATTLAFNALEKSALVTEDSISNFVSNKKTKKENAIISTLVNSNVYISGVIATDNDDNYRIYPPSATTKFTPSQQDWYASGAKSGVINYSDYSITIKKNGKEQKIPVMLGSADMYDDDINKVGNITLGITLKTLSEKIKSKKPPYDGSFFIANLSGKVIMGTNTNGTLTLKIPDTWMVRAENTDEGFFFDPVLHKYIYFKSSNNPDWAAFTIIPEDSFDAFVSKGRNASILLTIIGSIFSIGIYMAMSTYIKSLLTTIYMQSNGIEIKKKNATFESVSETISDKSKKLKSASTASFTDELTGLFNRRKLTLDIYKLISSDSDFYFALLDLDNFKSINDVFGHVKGDSVLKYVSMSGMEIMGNNHPIYRYGGEELAVIFKGNDKNEYLQLLNTWRVQVAHKKWREKGLSASFSGGFCAYSNNESEEQLFARADKLLYEAKRRGKNQIAHHQSLSQVI
jgi:diguanylate cyclase (GGDEF)-like protein